VSRAQKRAQHQQYLHAVQVGLAITKIQNREHNREIEREARRWLEMKRLAEGGQVVRAIPEDAAHPAIQAWVQPDRDSG
jgi:hypothetical protein